MTLEEAVAKRVAQYWKEAWIKDDVDPGWCVDVQLSWKNFCSGNIEDLFMRAETHQFTDAQRMMILGMFDFVFANGESEYGLDTEKMMDLARDIAGAECLGNDYDNKTGRWYVAECMDVPVVPTNDGETIN